MRAPPRLAAEAAGAPSPIGHPAPVHVADPHRYSTPIFSYPQIKCSSPMGCVAATLFFLLAYEWYMVVVMGNSNEVRVP